MTFLIFVIILGILILVHESGHFLVAKKAGVKVEEFGFGYPPRAFKIGEKWGTLFSLNWIPFGGFVKIFGENYEDGDFSFASVSKKWQVAILSAGVIFNIIFAWFLFSLGFLIGMPTPAENDFGMEVKNPVLTIVGILPNSPAKTVGLKTGDKIKEMTNNSVGNVLLEIDRGGKILNFEIKPISDLTADKKIIGIEMDMVGTLSLPLHKAIYEGGRTTLRLSYLTVVGIANLIREGVVGKADFSQVAGPVGIIGLVGDASRLGFAYLVSFTALISINLAVINLVPFPALDGGRILFVAIEGLIKRKINPKFVNILNTIGFALLIIIMLIVTYRDILKLF